MFAKELRNNIKTVIWTANSTFMDTTTQTNLYPQYSSMCTQQVRINDTQSVKALPLYTAILTFLQAMNSSLSTALRILSKQKWGWTRHLAAATMESWSGPARLIWERRVWRAGVRRKGTGRLASSSPRVGKCLKCDTENVACMCELYVCACVCAHVWGDVTRVWLRENMNQKLHFTEVNWFSRLITTAICMMFDNMRTNVM